MTKGIEVRLRPGDGERLEALIGSGKSQQKDVRRARIMLLRDDRVRTMATQRRTSEGKPTIWRWQTRFMAEVVDGCCTTRRVRVIPSGESFNLPSSPRKAGTQRWVPAFAGMTVLPSYLSNQSELSAPGINPLAAGDSAEWTARTPKPW
jgi:hypothetical protein